MTLRDKTLVITGVASGIGAEVARLARLQGAIVIGVDRNEPTMTLHGFYQTDLGDRAAIDALIGQLPGDINALCNIAGVPGTAEADLVGRVNYLGLRHLSQALLGKMQPGAAIVNVASILGNAWPERLDLHRSLAATRGFAEGADWLARHPVPQDNCYQYFKEALIVWTITQAPVWFRDYDVRMNCVAPGPVFTPILGDFVTMLGEERVARDARSMKRPAYADEIADVVAFLCTDDARWICGVNLPIDGGLAATYV